VSNLCISFKKTMSSTLLVFEVTVLGCKFCSVLFDIQFLNDFASVNSKERQFGEELYSSEVKLNIFHPARFPLFLSGNIFNIPL
jgi:hypothetical protein